MSEVWKDVVGYEGRYQVSNLGRVKSLPRYKTNGCMRKLLLDKYGYRVVRLTINKVGKTIKVHRLVAEAFLPNEFQLRDVNHKNEIKTDNRVENLEWCDRSYNTNYGTANSRRRKSSTNCLSMSKPVIQMRLDGSTVQKYPSLNEVSRRTGYSIASVSMCCNGKREHAYGYKWRYAA